VSRAPLTVASVYNRYLTRGGEDEAFEAEIDLLERNEVRVVPVTAQTVVPKGGRERVKLGAGTIWSTEWHRAIARLIDEAKVELLHVHNTFPVISPSIYYAARKANVPIVQTLHNYRLICPSANLFRNGQVCEDCVGKIPYPGIRHRCYHGSRAQSALIATMLSTHRVLGTWSRTVDAYIALTKFARDKFVEGGLPAAKLTVKPNFVYPDPGTRTAPGDAALYVGRLSEEKGVRTMLSAWRELDVPLRIIGDGPLASEVTATVAEGRSPVEYLGRRPRTDVLEEMLRARFLLFPSEVYESFPITLVEAFACGLPVVSTAQGATGEVVENGRTGMCVEAGNPRDLRDTVKSAMENPERLEALGRNARREYELKYTSEQNFRQLTAIYERVLAARGLRSTAV
jgi:glycosyltransferase involved in cell wall biosynthesis